MRIFYGIHLKSSRLSTAFDIVRFISESDSIRFSHITMRGPYSKPLNKSALENLNKSYRRDWTVRLDGAGSFMTEHQNTVLVRVDLLQLKDLVYKPDYADGIPHITLYDGTDRVFAEKLISLLFKYDFHEYVEVNQLQRLSAKAPTGGNFSILYNEFHQKYVEYIGDSPDTKLLKQMSVQEKIAIIQRVLDDNFSRISDKLIRYSLDDRQVEFRFDDE